MARNRWAAILTALGAATLLAACSQASGTEFSAGARGDFGATQGGIQDMSLARELVGEGTVPPPEAFVVEGMFSEHDLPLQGEACETTLCLRGALAIAETGEGTPAGWMQVGMSSTIDPARFERPATTIIATVDVSGSMGWGYGDSAEEPMTPGEVSRVLLRRIADRLGPRDRIAIVTYGSDVWTPLMLTPGDEDRRIDRAIDGLEENGSTNMEAGLERAYELARGAVGTTEQVRVMLFTDVRPNVGATSGTAFEGMVRSGAEDGVGMTLLSMGQGLDPELSKAMSHLRGANAFALFDEADVDETMEDDWPWMVSPIAYDLEVALEPSSGFTVAEGYGFPAGDSSEQATLDVSTVFLSKNKGALLLRFAPADGVDPSELAVAGRIAYRTPEGERIEKSLDLAWRGDPAEGWYEQTSTGKAVALARLVGDMKNAAEQYAPESPARALETLRSARDRFAADAAELGGEDMQRELDLTDELLTLMEEGAPQDSPYPGER